MKIACVHCGQPYPESGASYKCLNCGGLFDYVEPLTLSELNRSVSLGEGSTPLISAKVFDREVYFKCEYVNPTGSFKDRGTSALISFLRSRGIIEAIEDFIGKCRRVVRGLRSTRRNQSAGIYSRLCFRPKAKTNRSIWRGIDSGSRPTLESLGSGDASRRCRNGLC